MTFDLGEGYVEVILSVALFLVGVALLYKGADFLVLGAARTARRLGVSPLIIGLTIVAFGTSFPEWAVSATAAIGANEVDIAVGNALGSNIINILLVLGTCALILPIKVTKKVVIHEAPVMLIASWIFCGLVMFGAALELIDGIIMLLAFVIYLMALVSIAKKSRENIELYNSLSEESLWKNALFIVGGLVSIFIGSYLLVDRAVYLAQVMGVSEGVIGLSMVAIGTSLPELIVCCIAIRKAQTDISVGTIIGSNIFNILFILGTCAVVVPLIVTTFMFYNAIIMMLAFALIIFMLYTGYILSRAEGIVLLSLYGAYIGFLFVV